MESRLRHDGNRKLVLYDTTLRDGAQTRGLSFSLEDKLSITRKLCEFGMHYVEGGWPSSNPRDMKYFSDVRKLGLGCRISAFGMTSRKPGKDGKIADLIGTKADAVAIFGKAWDLHVRDVLGVSNDENLSMVGETVDYLKSHGFEVIFDAEHFMDGYKANPPYALEVLKAANGADAVVLADTNGGALPWEVARATSEARKAVRSSLGVHAHNDTGMAVMNTIVAVSCGADHVQGTMNGLGERCGNLDWNEFLPLAGLKLGMDVGVDLRRLRKASRYVERMTGFSLPRNKPFVGENAFSHKGGVHIDAMLKNPRAYEHMDPRDVGNATSFGLSEQVGRSGIVDAARRHGYEISKDSPEAAALAEMVKEGQGVTDAEMYLMITEVLDGRKEPFRFMGYETKVSSDGEAKSEVKVEVAGEVIHEISEGVGPVHAMDLAMRKALSKKFDVSALSLSNFRVRIVNQEKATAAKVEVFIEFRANGDAWSASSVSDDIIKASEQALLKGYKYYLLKNGGS